MSQDPLHLLCVEPRFPGRLGVIADWLVRQRGWRCWFCCSAAEPQDYWPPSVGKGLELLPCSAGGAAREPAIAWHRCLERGLCYAYGCWEALEKQRPRPIDLVLGRSTGLGSTLFVPTYLPGVPIVNLFDYFYHPHHHDLAEETGAELPATYTHWRQAANAMDLLDLENGGAPWTLSAWQRDLYPAVYHDAFTVLPDGVDTQRFHPRPRQGPCTIAGRTLPEGTHLVTFTALALDRLRGFDRFLDLANRLLRARRDVVCAVVGNPVVQRGLDVQFFHADYRAHLLAATPAHDPERLWFLGNVPQADLADLLARSDLHVYPGRAFPVARSLLEALASGCVVLAASTAPVREVLTDGSNSLLTPPADREEWERQALAVLGDPERFRPLGERAVALVRERYAQDVTLPQLAAWLTEVAGRR